MKKIFLTFAAFIFLFFGVALPVAAAPKLTNAQRIKVATYKTTKQITVTFSNLAYSRKITYQLTYNKIGGQEGAGGTVIPSKQKSVSKTLLFGTCSRNVCTYHRGVSNIVLKVTTWYCPSLTVETKTYTIK